MMFCRSFTQNYNVVTRNFTKYGSNKIDRSSLLEWEKQLPKLVYDGDDDDGNKDVRALGKALKISCF